MVPMAPWLPGPLAPLVPPTLNLQHLVAAPTLTQETSTKLSLKEGFASIWDKNWEAPMRPMAPHGPHDPPPPGSAGPKPSTFGSGANNHSGNKHEIAAVWAKNWEG